MISMGTRGMIGFVIDGKRKGIYNHFDSYPDGLGKDVVAFVQKVLAVSDSQLERFKSNIRLVKWIDENKDKPTKKDMERYAPLHDKAVSTGVDWYALLRNAQGVKGLELVYMGQLGHLIDGSEFIKDSLFCEFAYVLNLDDRTLEFYQGFQHGPQKDNPYGRKKDKDSGYYPCKLVGKVPFDQIPSDWMERFYPKED